ncbi:DUF1579 family protein [Nocardia uniformis]|uniref:DUF1579 family protein n=1 Tax=Nocardia uniformis TaxID=53432 RepID=A0A849C0R5_9NOCA|nr:DUF1579 family protein [Nocardia uniformis]NNH69935.1 DUF1579 family protein [Nocardia uniformis]
MNRQLSRMTVAAAFTALTAWSAGCAEDAAPDTAVPSTAAATTQQSPGHQRLDQLVGDWTGQKFTYVAGGTPDNPTTGEITSRWQWIAETGNNFLREEAGGTLGGNPYYRLGLFGYAPTDDRYEWTTVDNITPMTMHYQGARGSGTADGDISMSGEFTDPGALGPQFVGSTIAMRTVITLESADRATMEVHFAPPGQPEILADRVILTRRK